MQNKKTSIWKRKSPEQLRDEEAGIVLLKRAREVQMRNSKTSIWRERAQNNYGTKRPELFC